MYEFLNEGLVEKRKKKRQTNMQKIRGGFAVLNEQKESVEKRLTMTPRKRVPDDRFDVVKRCPHPLFTRTTRVLCTYVSCTIVT